jgi:tyrosine decarboxylase/aspartate 1-decarboxylase
MEENGKKEADVLRMVRKLKERDISFGSGRIFGSMCTTPHPLAARVNSEMVEANLGNPGLYPGTLEMERRVIKSIGALLHLKDPFGHVLSGGTEANITSLYRAKRMTGKRKVIFPASVHFSVWKAIKLLDLEPVMIKLDRSFSMCIDDLEEKISDDVACVFTVAGSTELGSVDRIERISEITGDVPIHVDAAFGGFVLPFLEDVGLLPENIRMWDFRVEGVTTISVDPHKMGGSTIPAGCLLFREEYPLKYLSVESPYLTSSKAYTLAGTRDSGAVCGALAVMEHLGREGYRQRLMTCMDNTHYLKHRMMEMGLDPVMEPLMNIVAFHHEDPFRIQKEMERKGFYISRIREPSAIRFVVMPHVTGEAIDRMLTVLKGVIDPV